MFPPGRNAPCPCGSGRKHKHCCLRTTSVIPLVGAYSPGDRVSAMAKLLRFGERPHFRERGRRAADQFGVKRALSALREDSRLAEAEDESLAAFTTWLAFDFVEPGEESGRTLARRFLTWLGADITPGERAWLELMSGSAVRLYEVQEVELDCGLTLRDLAADRTVRVTERLATRQVARWDLLGLRVVSGPGETLVVEGISFLYPEGAREEILHALDRHTREIRRSHPGVDDLAVSKLLGALFHHLWLDHVVMRPDPVIVTAAGGDPIVFTKAVFDVPDPAGVTSRLAEHPELQAEKEGGGVFIWTESKGPFDRVLGRVELEGNRLILETMSEPRAARGRKLLEKVLGDAVRYRASRIETLDQAMAHRPAAPAARADVEIAPEEREVMVGFLEEHYRTWPDHPLPALDGRTPRHAARLKTQRARVVSLLKDLESHMERDRQEGRPAIDLGWLWDDLRLERPVLEE